MGLILYYELLNSALLDSIQKSEASAAKSQIAHVPVKSRGAGRFPSLAATPEGLLWGEQPSLKSSHAVAKAVNEFFQVHAKQYWYFINYLKYLVHSGHRTVFAVQTSQLPVHRCMVPHPLMILFWMMPCFDRSLNAGRPSSSTIIVSG